MSFASLGLGPELERACADLGYTEPTPIQAQAIAPVLRGADLLALAQTGSGKTAAFALPLLQGLHGAPASQAAPARGRRPVRVLVLVPTRELAAQVGEVFRSLGQGLAPRPKIAVLFGGVSINPQMMGLRGGADIVVATPGRLLDLVERNALRLSEVQSLVLDEADRLLDLGFSDELHKVLALLPARRQTLFFSATFPDAVQALAQPLLHEPVRIEIAAPPAPERLIVQRAIEVDPQRRTELLKHLLQQAQVGKDREEGGEGAGGEPGESGGEGAWDRVLVFVSTRYATEHVALKLYKSGIYATPFHGEMSQGKRTEVLQEFKDGRWDVVVTTDLAARGIDIPLLPVVVNYDLPRSADQYVHRIGRTGRAGASGLAVSFVSPDTEAHFRLIEKRQGMTVPREQVPGFEPQQAPAVAAQGHEEGAARGQPQRAGKLPPGTGGIKGKRPSKKDKLRAAAAAEANNRTPRT